MQKNFSQNETKYYIFCEIHLKNIITSYKSRRDEIVELKSNIWNKCNNFSQKNVCKIQHVSINIFVYCEIPEGPHFDYFVCLNNWMIRISY